MFKPMILYCWQQLAANSSLLGLWQIQYGCSSPSNKFSSSKVLFTFELTLITMHHEVFSNKPLVLCLIFFFFLPFYYELSSYPCCSSTISCLRVRTDAALHCWSRSAPQFTVVTRTSLKDTAECK